MFSKTNENNPSVSICDESKDDNNKSNYKGEHNEDCLIKKEEFNSFRQQNSKISEKESVYSICYNNFYFNNILC